MNLKRNLTIIYLCLLSFAFGQIHDTATIHLRGVSNTNYYIDGFIVYNTQLTQSDSINILKTFVSNLNGCWSNSKSVYIFKLSKKTITGTQSIKGQNSETKRVRLVLQNKQVKLIETDLNGKVLKPENIRIDKMTLLWKTNKKLIITKEQGNAVNYPIA